MTAVPVSVWRGFVYLARLQGRGVGWVEVQCAGWLAEVGG